MSIEPLISHDRFTFLPRCVATMLPGQDTHTEPVGGLFGGLWGMQPLRWTLSSDLPGADLTTLDASPRYDRWSPPLLTLSRYTLWTPADGHGAVTIARTNTFAQFEPATGHPILLTTAASASGIPLWTRQVTSLTTLTAAVLDVHTLMADADAFLSFAALATRTAHSLDGFL
jgi:hypothetical protein